MAQIRILIVEDHPLMRQALEIAILTQSDMEIVGQAENGLVALQMLPQVKPDVILMDLLMPRMGGLETIPQVFAQDPQAKILVITSADDETMIMKAVQSGVSGYLTKSAERDEIVTAVRTVHAGDPYFPQHITAKLLNTVRQSEAPLDDIPKNEVHLTPREKDVLQYLGQGFSNHQIAAALHLAPGTIRFHMHRLMGKLGFENRSEAVAYAVRKKTMGE
jgi:two-component system, NarL family, response regulator LiaR